METLEAWLEVGEAWADFGSMQPWETVKIITARRNGRMVVSHQIAALSGASQAGKLKPVETYLSRGGVAKQQSPEEIARRLDNYFDAYESHQRAREDG